MDGWESEDVDDRFTLTAASVLIGSNLTNGMEDSAAADSFKRDVFLVI